MGSGLPDCANIFTVIAVADAADRGLDAGLGKALGVLDGHVDTLAAVAATLNGRPPKTLGWKTPAEALYQYLEQIDKQHDATTD